MRLLRIWILVVTTSLLCGGMAVGARVEQSISEDRDANETPAEVLGGVQTYDYRYALPTPFQAAAGTKYWVQIEAYQSGAPDWGLSKASEGDGYYFRTDGYIYQIVAGDAAFALLGPGYKLYLPCVSRTETARR
jgi:hypothetical protein